MAKIKSPVSTIPSPDYQVQDDMNTLMRHNQLVSDKPRHSKVMGTLRDIVSQHEKRSEAKTSARKVKRDNARAIGRP